MKTYKSIIKRSDENKLAIRWKFGKRHGRNLIINQRLQQGSSRCIPNLTRSIMAPRNNQWTISVKMHWRHWHSVRADHVLDFPCFHIPNSNRIVKSSRNNQIRLRIEVHTKDSICVAFQRLHALGGAYVPDTESPVVGRGADVCGVRGPGKIAYALRMAD